ncbi:hypothetical protein T439DRAFT_325407 [Meredithblackwellia eburnea MCA 4105]
MDCRTIQSSLRTGVQIRRRDYGRHRLHPRARPSIWLLSDKTIYIPAKYKEKNANTKIKDSAGSVVMLGERGSVFEETYFGGRLGAYFLGQNAQRWEYCCGLYLCKWDEEQQAFVERRIRPSSYEKLWLMFENMPPLEDFLEAGETQMKAVTRTSRRVDSEGDEMIEGIVALDLSVEVRYAQHGQSASFEEDEATVDEDAREVRCAQHRQTPSFEEDEATVDEDAREATEEEVGFVRRCGREYPHLQVITDDI